jgi:serine protease inhibitor
MKRAWTLLPFVVLAGCGGTNSNLNQPAGLYTNSARDARERQELVTKATAELGKSANVKTTAALNGFGFNLLRGTEGQTRMVSPLSVSTALLMTANGAEGATQKAMLAGLGLEKVSLNQANDANKAYRQLLGNVDPSVTLNIANAIWVDNRTSIKADFLKQNEANYGAKASTLDFRGPNAVKTINDWVREATAGKISDLVQELDDDSRVVLTNAVYMKSNWSDPFEPEATVEGDFKSSAEKSVRVPFMNATRFMQYADLDGTKAVVLPYGSQRFEFIAVLPKDMPEYVKTLDSARWTKLMGAVKQQRVALKLPKFKAEFTADLNSFLKEAGMGVAFEAGKANFKAMADEDLYISSVVHKTFIDVTEAGTEAAAATKVEMKATAMPIEQPATPLVFDRPFVYAIRERETGVLLFIGTFSG